MRVNGVIEGKLHRTGFEVAHVCLELLCTSASKDELEKDIETMQILTISQRSNSIHNIYFFNYT